MLSQFCENWFLTKLLLAKLESFQAEIGRRILALSCFHSGCAVQLGWPSIGTRVLAKKLAFLSWVLKNSLLLQLRYRMKALCKLLDGCSFLNGLEGFVERIKEDSMRSRKNSPLYLKSRRLTLAHLRQLKLLLAQNLGPGP